MTQLDEQLSRIKKAREKEYAGIVKRVATLVKKASCNTGTIEWQSDGNTYYVMVENDGRLGDQIVDIVRKSKLGIVILIQEWRGSYDWKADTYSRPCSRVAFTF